MESHEYASIFPLATDAELKEMAADIKQRGLLHPVVLLDGKVLDGRNRVRACEIAGVEPDYVDYYGDDPLADIISWNLHRRQLTTSQKAEVAREIKPMFEKQAKERMLATLKKGDVPASANLRQRDKGKSTQKAATALGVSTRVVEDAEHVHKKAPELSEEIKAGRMTVHAAKEEVKQREKPRRSRDPLDVPFEAQPVKDDHDSKALFHLKRYWRQATKRDQKLFRRWIDENKS